MLCATVDLDWHGRWDSPMLYLARCHREVAKTVPCALIGGSLSVAILRTNGCNADTRQPPSRCRVVSRVGWRRTSFLQPFRATFDLVSLASSKYSAAGAPSQVVALAGRFSLHSLMLLSACVHSRRRAFYRIAGEMRAKAGRSLLSSPSGKCSVVLRPCASLVI